MKLIAKIAGTTTVWAATAALALAQTTGGTGVTGTTTTGTTGSGVGATIGSTTTPGIPNTGAAGDAFTNVLLLGISAAVVIVGLVYLARARKA